jgi:hypothetical protein
LDSADLRSRPLTERRKLVERLLKKALENIKFSEELTGKKGLGVTKQFQLEGLIITLRIIWPKLLRVVWHIAAWSLDQHCFRSPAPVLVVLQL